MHKVALVGKPNVGKSTLFNRLIGTKKAIVDDKPGVTRDRNYGVCEWLTKQFQVVDTGGIINDPNQPLQVTINQQVNYAIAEADLIVFLVSSKEGINTDDYYIAKLLKKNTDKNVLLVVNKSENQDYSLSNLYYSLGFGEPLYVSAEHAMGIGDMLDIVVKKLKLEDGFKRQEEPFSFCVIGRPNVGKSSLVNCILGQDRVIVSPVANTTRDSIDSQFVYHNKPYVIIDTAGIRRKGKISDNIDKYSYLRSQQAISRSKLILLVLDGSEEFNEQDEIVGGLAHAANIPTIIVVNKWDDIKKDNDTMNLFIKKIRSNFNYIFWAPIVFVSAKENKRVQTIFSEMNDIQNKLKIKVSTSLLNDVIAKAQILNPPPKFKGSRISLSYATQVESQIPTFVIFSNDPKFLHFSYGRYIENQIRQAFDLNNIPITIYFKDKNARIRKD